MVGNHAIRCAKRSGHGLLDLKQAITFSCNPYFMEVGCHTGIEELYPFFAAAGFGEKTGLDFPESVSGIAPQREYAQKNLHRDWLTVDTAYVSIGQGIVMLHRCRRHSTRLPWPTAAFSTNHTWSKKSSTGGEVLQAAPVIRHRIPAAEEHFRLLRSAMSRQYRRRNGFRSASYRAVPAAQTGLRNRQRSGSQEGYLGDLLHPRSPEYAIACLIEKRVRRQNRCPSSSFISAALAQNHFRRIIPIFCPRKARKARKVF